MTRRCKHKPCTTELPPASKCNDIIQKKGFCGVECLTQKTRDDLEAKRLKQIRKVMSPHQHSRRPAKKRTQEQLTQEMFNKMIRLLDSGTPCISCGRDKCGAGWDAGHFRSVGACLELRFDPRNCHRQGSGCNRANRRPDKNNLKGAETIAREYEARLRDRYGDKLVDWVKGPHEMPRWRDDDLRALRKVFAAECRRLERGEGMSRDWRSLDYKINDLIE